MTLHAYFLDRSPLLLCRTQNDLGLEHKVADQLEHGGFGPQVISPRSLQVYKGKKFEHEGKVFKIIKAIWKQNKSSNCNVAVKFLKKENEEKLMKVSNQEPQHQNTKTFR